MLIDFHTHAPLTPRYIGRDDVCVVQSLMPDECPDPRADYITWGVHPLSDEAVIWVEAYKADATSAVERMRAIIDGYRELYPEQPVIAVGECGWDKRSAHLSPEEQTLLVRLHDDVGRLMGLPLVLHVVGGWHILLAERKRSTNPKRWYVHGFRGNPKLLEQLRDAGIYVSMSPHYSWSYLPPRGTFFLETDDDGGTIESLYSRVARCYGVGVEKLEKELLWSFNDM